MEILGQDMPKLLPLIAFTLFKGTQFLGRLASSQIVSGKEAENNAPYAYSTAHKRVSNGCCSRFEHNGFANAAIVS